MTPGSAVNKAGVKRGDWIASFNGQQVNDFNTLGNSVAEVGPGSNAEVMVLRDGSEKKLTVKLDEAAASKSARLGDGGSGEGGSVLGWSWVRTAELPGRPANGSRAVGKTGAGTLNRCGHAANTNMEIARRSATSTTMCP